MATDSTPTVVVTGAAGGIGLEIVKQLRSRARVIAVVLDAEQAIVATEAGAWRCVACDIGNAAQVDAAIAAINAAIPGQELAALIHCVAIQTVAPCELIKRAELEKFYAVNVFGTLQLVQGMIPALRNARGRMLLFSSLGGRLATPMLGAYTSSKYALEALADVMRRELSLCGVTVSLIEPGGVLTPLVAAQPRIVEQGLAQLEAPQRKLYEPMYRGYLAMTEKGKRYASAPADVARVAVDVALGPGRPKARYVIGADARLMLLLVRLLPVRWLDRLLMKIIVPR